MREESAEDQVARYEAFEARAASLERRARARYAEAAARLAAGDAPAAVPLLEAALAELQAAEALQHELLPDLQGESPELRLVEGVLRTVQERIARGETGPWKAPGAPDAGPEGDGRGRRAGTFEA